MLPGTVLLLSANPDVAMSLGITSCRTTQGSGAVPKRHCTLSSLRGLTFPRQSGHGYDLRGRCDLFPFDERVISNRRMNTRAIIEALDQAENRALSLVAFRTWHLYPIRSPYCRKSFPWARCSSSYPFGLSNIGSHFCPAIVDSHVRHIAAEIEIMH